jgi:hypothetical protein
MSTVALQGMAKLVQFVVVIGFLIVVGSVPRVFACSPARGPDGEKVLMCQGPRLGE